MYYVSPYTYIVEAMMGNGKFSPSLILSRQLFTQLNVV